MEDRKKANYADLIQTRNLWITYAYIFCTYGSITYYLFHLPVWLSENGLDAGRIGVVL